jgi:hypothetical protein
MLGHIHQLTLCCDTNSFHTDTANLSRLFTLKLQVTRLFDNLDSERRGTLTFDEFFHGIKRWRWLRRVVVDLNFPNDFTVPTNYDYATTTFANYAVPVNTTPQSIHLNQASSLNEASAGFHWPDPTTYGQLGDATGSGFVGEHAEVRARLVELDLVSPQHFIPARQRWQDALIKALCSKTEPQAQPWVSRCMLFDVRHDTHARVQRSS